MNIQEAHYEEALTMLRSVLNLPNMSLFDSFFTCKHSLTAPFWNSHLNKFVLPVLAMGKRQDSIPWDESDDDCRVFEIVELSPTLFDICIPVHVKIRQAISNNMFILICHLFHILTGPYPFSASQFFEATNANFLRQVKTEFEHVFNMVYSTADKVSLNSCLVLKTISSSTADFYNLIKSFVNDFNVEQRICLRQNAYSRRIQKAFLKKK